MTGNLASAGLKVVVSTLADVVDSATSYTEAGATAYNNMIRSGWYSLLSASALNDLARNNIIGLPSQDGIAGCATRASYPNNYAHQGTALHEHFTTLTNRMIAEGFAISTSQAVSGPPPASTNPSGGTPIPYAFAS